MQLIKDSFSAEKQNTLRYRSVVLLVHFRIISDCNQRGQKCCSTTHSSVSACKIWQFYSRFSISVILVSSSCYIVYRWTLRS